MLNNAWPSMIWHLYDYYLDAGGGYYGTRKACEPLHVQYSDDDHSVVVVNSTYQSVPGLHVKAAVYDLQLHPVYEHESALNANPDSADRAFSIPAELLTDGGNLHFVRLTLTDAAGRQASENFYWVPAKLAEFDWRHEDYRYTPALHEPDLTALKGLPKSHVSVESVKTDADGRVTVRLANDSQAMAFQIALRALDEHAAPVTPAFWSDNYVSLLPGESRTFTVRPSAHGGLRIASIEVTGWNVIDQRVPVKRSAARQRFHETAALPFARASASANQPRRSDASGTLDR
jgi:exo-1,4-beta-D-glucosaminidase